MKPYGSHFKRRYPSYTILVIFSILPALFAVKHIIISPDSIVYSLISQEILSGNGIRIPMIYSLKDIFVFIDGTVPHLGEPPFLSILFALFGSVTAESYFAAQVVNVISHVFISIFTFLLIKNIYDNKGIALFTGILVSLSFPLLWDAHHMVAEPLFTALATATLYLLSISRNSNNARFTKNIFIASLCMSAAILTKYAGVALIPVFFWWAFTLGLNKKIKSKYTSTIAITILPLVTTSAIFLRNFMLMGEIFGWSPPSPERSFSNAFTEIETLKIAKDWTEMPASISG